MADAFDDIIILRSVYGKVGQKYFLNPVRDPKTGRFPEHIRSVDSNGDMIMLPDDRDKKGQILIAENKVYIIEDGTTFNLNDPHERADWYAIQHCPLIAMSRDQRDAKGNLVIDGDSKRYGSAELYVERPGYEANKRVSKKRLIHQAESLIINDKAGAEGRLKMAKMLGRPMRNANDADVEDFLLTVAAKEPQTIIDFYTGDEAVYRLLLIDARDKNIIYTKNKLYMYGEQGIVLGATDDAAITWMRNPSNRKLLEMIKREVYPEYYEEAKPETVMDLDKFEASKTVTGKSQKK